MSAFNRPHDDNRESKYRHSTSSLPRSPSSIETTTMAIERKFGASQRFSNFICENFLLTFLIIRSSSVMQVSEGDMDHKKTLQELNTRLVSYVEKVRKLQMATDVIDAMPKQKGLE